MWICVDDLYDSVGIVWHYNEFGQFNIWEFVFQFIAPSRVRFAERISRLYEQGADCLRIGEYVKLWFKWVRKGIRKKDWVGLSMMNGKRLHPSVYEECRRPYNQSNLVNKDLALINCFLIPSTSCFCSYHAN